MGILKVTSFLLPCPLTNEVPFHCFNTQWIGELYYGGVIVGSFDFSLQVFSFHILRNFFLQQLVPLQLERYYQVFTYFPCVEYREQTILKTMRSCPAFEQGV